MKLVYTIALLSALVIAPASFAKGRPMPKPKPPIHKCPAGQKWNKSMKMCM